MVFNGEIMKQKYKNIAKRHKKNPACLLHAGFPSLKK